MLYLFRFCFYFSATAQGVCAKNLCSEDFIRSVSRSLFFCYDVVVSSEQWRERKKSLVFFSNFYYLRILLVCFFHCFARFLVDSEETIKLNEKSLWSAIYQMTRLIQNAYTHSHRPARPHRYRVGNFKRQFKDVIFFPWLVGEKLKKKIHLKYQKFLTSLYIQMNRNRTKRTRVVVESMEGKEKNTVIEMNDTRTKRKKKFFVENDINTIHSDSIAFNATHIHHSHNYTCSESSSKTRLRDTYGRHSTSHYDDDFLDKPNDTQTSGHEERGEIYCGLHTRLLIWLFGKLSTPHTMRGVCCVQCNDRWTICAPRTGLCSVHSECSTCNYDRFPRQRHTYSAHFYF